MYRAQVQVSDKQYSAVVLSAENAENEDGYCGR